MKIEKLIDSIRENRVRITEHADEEAASDKLKYEEIYFSVFKGKTIDNYSDDKPYPSCLVYGNTFSGAPVHSVRAYNSKTKWAVLITVYRPDPDKWINWIQRIK